MGSVQFQIDELDPVRRTVKMKIIDGPESLLMRDYDCVAPIKVGRKAENTISFPDDLHLSNSHAEIFLLDQCFYLEDRASTNG